MKAVELFEISEIAAPVEITVTYIGRAAKIDISNDLFEETDHIKSVSIRSILTALKESYSKGGGLRECNILGKKVLVQAPQGSKLHEFYVDGFHEACRLLYEIERRV
ncbi:hypothetical protein N9K75_02130 [bacterium]|nr:hypothetical protein [bacterium]